MAEGEPMTDPDRMVVWLRETMDAAEQVANAAARRAWSPHWEYDRSVREIRDLNNGGTLANIYFPAIGNFSADNDPAAALRRIAADRKQLAEHAPVPDHGRLSDHGGCERFSCDCVHLEPPVCRSCRTCTSDPVEAPCPSLEHLAEGWGWTEGE
jgi:hypothetical protein